MGGGGGGGGGEIIEEEPSPRPAPQVQPHQPSQPVYTALYTYSAADEDEISFMKGMYTLQIGFYSGTPKCRHV